MNSLTPTNDAIIIKISQISWDQWQPTSSTRDNEYNHLGHHKAWHKPSQEQSSHPVTIKRIINTTIVIMTASMNLGHFVERAGPQVGVSHHIRNPGCVSRSFAPPPPQLPSGPPLSQPHLLQPESVSKWSRQNHSLWLKSKVAPDSPPEKHRLEILKRMLLSESSLFSEDILLWFWLNFETEQGIFPHSRHECRRANCLCSSDVNNEKWG